MDFFSVFSHPDTPPPDSAVALADDGFTPEPEATEPPAPRMVDFDYGTCPNCGRDVPYEGRGPRNKKCADCKAESGSRSQNRTKGKATAGSVEAPAAATPSEKARLQNITDDLVSGAGEVAGFMAPFMPVTAGTLAATGPGAMGALVSIAKDHPKFLAGLEKAAKTVPYTEIAKFVVAMAMATMVDFGKVDPYGAAGELLGVAAVAEKMGWTPPGAQPQAAKPASAFDNTAPPPPAFVMVTK